MTEVVVVEREVLVTVEVGHQGPPGADGLPGAPGAGYVHTQASASSSWLINHNLGIRPSVAVVDTGGNELDAEVVHTNTNQTVINFTAPTAGFARLS